MGCGTSSFKTLFALGASVTFVLAIRLVCSTSFMRGLWGAEPSVRSMNASAIRWLSTTSLAFVTHTPLLARGFSDERHRCWHSRHSCRSPLMRRGTSLPLDWHQPPHPFLLAGFTSKLSGYPPPPYGSGSPSLGGIDLGVKLPLFSAVFVLLLGLDLIPRRKRVGVRTLGGIVLNGILLAVPRIGVSFNSRSRDAGLPLGPLSTRSSHCELALRC